MSIKWRSMKEERPADGQECLTLMKHGLISGFFDAGEAEFSGYYFNDLNWIAKYWVPIEEIDQPK